MHSDEILQAYINKMLTLQNEQRDKPLTSQELKEIALDLGMSEEDWQASQKAFQGHLASGTSHLTYNNWKDAIKELENAVALNPNSLEAVAGLAKAYKGYWNENQDNNFKIKAEQFAELALQIQPGHQATINLLRELRTTELEISKSQKSRKIFVYSVAGGVLVVLFIAYFFLNNAIVAQKEAVKRQWAQVENVYERRADLIPNLLKTVKESVKFDQEVLNKIGKLQQQSVIKLQDLSENTINQYQQSQDELLAEVKKLIDQANQNPTLSANQAFRDLLEQIEGSENRIRVERKKYNEAVSGFNTTIQSFPHSLLGYKEIPYLKMKKGADQTPELNFN